MGTPVRAWAVRGAAVLGAAAAAWAAKLLVLATLDAGDAAFWTGFAGSVALAATATTLLASAARGRPWLGAALFTAAFSLPLARDVHAAVAVEAPGKAAAYTLGAYLLSLLLSTATRGAALAGAAGIAARCARGGHGRGHGRGPTLARAVVFPYVALTAVEAATLAYAPLLFLAALPVPVPAARPWREAEAARVPEADRVERALVVLVDPRFDDPRRLALSREAAEAPETFAASLAGAVREALASAGRAGDGTGGVVTGAPWRRATLVFPETFLNLEGPTFRALWPALAERLADLTVDGGVEILMGARVGDANVVFSGARDALTGRPLGGVIHAKDAFVPFYEAPLAGVSVRGDDAASPLDAGSGEWLARRGAAVATAAGAATPLTALICYEALFPWRWPAGGDALVLTNHHAFARPGLASALYDAALRQIARAAGARVFLAANEGASGVFGADARDAGEGLAFAVARLGGSP